MTAKKVTLSSRIWEPEPAAAAFRLRSLAGRLSELGTSVRVHTSTPPPKLVAEAQETDSKASFVVKRHKVLRGKDGYLRGYAQYLSFDIPLLFHLLLDKTPDVYVCEPPPTTGVITRIVSTLTRKPYVYYAADIWSDASEGADVPGFVVKALRMVESWVLRGASSVIAVNDEVARRAKNMGAKHVETVRNGVDTEIFRPEGPASPLQGQRFFVYAGTMSEWQGSEIFVEALAQIHREFPDVRLVFVGQGNAITDIEEAAQRHGVGHVIDILPPVGPEEAATYQRDAVAALVSIKPGIGYDMAYPTKTMAAWACGTPVIYSGVGVATEPLVQNSLGWAADYRSIDVARAMRASLTSTPDRQRIASWASQNVSLASVADRVATVIANQA